MSDASQIRIYMSLLGNREELDKIEAAFQWLKWEFDISKMELYKKALLWVASDEEAKQKFAQYLMNEKAKDKIMKIKE
jgi:hypothetical protein